jgi:hypothetical protein
MPRTDRYPYRADIHAKLIVAAVLGQTVDIGDLGGRFMTGRYLYRILREERAAWRPPLTALAVTKRTGRPPRAFFEGMREIAFLRDGESDDDSWQRAVQEVRDYWRLRLHDRLQHESAGEGQL